MKISLCLEFDDTNSCDTSQFSKITQIINGQNSSPSISFSGNTPSYTADFMEKISQLESEKRELEQDIKRYNKEVQKNQQEIQTKNSSIETLKEENKNLQSLLEEAQQHVKESEDNCMKMLAEEQEKYRKLKQNTEYERRTLEREIEKLKGKIEMYEPNIGIRFGEDQFYNISGTVLVQTMDDKAPYIAKMQSDGNSYIFQFNKNKGPVVQACENRDEMLNPFCMIIGEIPDGANSIGWGTWGTAKSTPSGDLKVEIPAQIKLTKV